MVVLLRYDAAMLITATCFFALLMLYITLRVIVPLHLHWRWKLLLAALMLPAVLKFAFLRVCFPAGRYFAPEAPAAVLLPLTWMTLVLMLFAALLLAAEVVKLPVWSSLRMYGVCIGHTWRRCMAALHAVLLLVACTAVSIGMHNALSLPQVRELTVELEGMPADAAPVKLALLADLHADSIKGADFFAPIVEQTNALGADVIAVAGDFVDGDVAHHGADLEPLRQLHAPLGVYAVSGNHDYYSGHEEWSRYLTERGFRMLDNGHVLLGNSGIVLAGVADISAPLVEEQGADIDHALRGAPAGAPVVLLCHQPRFAPVAAEKGVALQLSGHTHGGMVRGLDALIAVSNNGYVAGAYQVGKMLLYVSRGTNLWSGMLVRLGVPAEITLITLKPKN